MAGIRWAANATPTYASMADTPNLDDGVDGDTVTGESHTYPNGLTGGYVAGCIDLGSLMLVDEIRVTGAAAVAGGHSADYSTDDSSYSHIEDAFPGWLGNHQQIITFAAVSAQFWRVSIVDQDPGDGPVTPRISDLRLFYLGSPVTPPTDCPVPPPPTIRAVPSIVAGVGRITILGNQ